MTKLESLHSLIGNTPLIKIKYKYNNNIRYVYAKLEWYNLTGSIKDRVALGIISNAYKTNTLTPHQTIVETTSGNMGISLSAIGNYLGHPVVIFMPKHMSKERQEILKLYGAKLILLDSFADCFREANIYAKKHNAFLSLQFENIDNPLSHYSSTAIEISEKITPKYFVAGVGTAGTLMGVGKYLVEHFDSKIIAVEPKSSLILSSGYSHGHHKLQGLSDDIIPNIYDKNLVNDIISVSDEDAIAMAQKLSSTLGLGVGISSGANMIGAILSNKKEVVTIFTDDNKKYISTDLVYPTISKLVDSVELISYEVI